MSTCIVYFPVYLNLRVIGLLVRNCLVLPSEIMSYYLVLLLSLLLLLLSLLLLLLSLLLLLLFLCSIPLSRFFLLNVSRPFADII